jgi:hypothetical protein
MIFKSAVAFFFLFFLHGFSIGTRQQGISYNLLIEDINNKQLPNTCNRRKLGKQDRATLIGGFCFFTLAKKETPKVIG